MNKAPDIFNSSKIKRVSKKLFNKQIKEKLKAFPKGISANPDPKTTSTSPDPKSATADSDSLKQKSSQFKQELSNLNDFTKQAQQKYQELKQKAFTHFNLKHMYSEMIELTAPKDRGSMRSRFRKENKNFEKTLNNANELVEISNSPYFGRIDFSFADDTTNPKYRNKTIPFYIGKKSLSLKNKKITDWRAPIASIYYNFPKPTKDCFYKTDEQIINGNLKLKRKIDIEKGRLTKVYDGNELTSLVGSDPFLLKQLDKSASAKLKDIISTIQSSQNKIISLEPTKDIIVQGVAGSGKTSIAIHRLSWLLYNYKNIKASKCLIIAPSKLFLRYIKDLLPEIGAENVPQSTFNDWAIYRLSDVVEKKDIMKENIEPKKKSSLDFMNFIEKTAKKYKNKKVRTSEILDIYKNHTRINQICLDDLAPLLYLKVLIKGINPNNKIDYLVIDEAQDRSPAEILILKKFTDTGRNMLVGDLLQGIINPNGIESWEHLIENLFDEQRTEFYTIRTSYRSTKQIIKFVNNRLRLEKIPSGLLPQPVLRDGPKPTVTKQSDPEKIISDIIKTCHKAQKDNRHNIAIIVPQKFREFFYKEIQKEFPEITLLNDDNMYKGGLSIGHVQIYKGLEFDCVIIVNFPEADYQQQIKSFYVACTRAMHQLHIIEPD